MSDVRFINLVDPPVSLTYDANGQASVPLPEKSGIVDVSRFRKISVLIGSTKATSFSVVLGTFSGPSTLAQELRAPTDLKIHTFEVAGPEIAMWLSGAAPGTKEEVQLWVFLHQ